MCKVDMQTGELLSRRSVEELLAKIKKNYDYSKEKGMLEELLHGKWKNAYHNLVKSVEDPLNVYLKEVLFQYKFILNNETGMMYVKKMHEILQNRKTDINKAVKVGDMQQLDIIVNEVSDACMSVYADYMSADYNNLVQYNAKYFNLKTAVAV